MIKGLKSIFITQRTYLIALGITLLFLAGGFIETFYWLSVLTFYTSLALITLELILLFKGKSSINANRKVPHRLSNGDKNPITIEIENKFQFKVFLDIIDEIPHQFQKRDVNFKLALAPFQFRQIEYTLEPKKRGVYNFGALRIYIKSSIGLIQRRINFDQNHNVAVYPSFLQLQKIDFLAAHEKLWQIGIKKQRRIGNSTEFEQIKNYVPGDDYRKINWKASARSQDLMVNHYIDERSQNMLAVVNIGRIMKMPFNGLSLLDYSINSTLAFLSLALKKHDRAGLVTFNNKVKSFVPPSKQKMVFSNINEKLYSIKEDFIESDYEQLSFFLTRQVTQRNFVFLYTNFETTESLKRALPFLKHINKKHRLIVSIFKNAILEAYRYNEPKNESEMHQIMMMDQLIQEKEAIRQILINNGIDCIYCKPEELTVESVNQYLRLKARGAV